MVAIGGSAGTSAVDVWSELVKLLTVLVGNDGSSRGPRISCECNATLLRHDQDRKQLDTNFISFIFTTLTVIPLLSFQPREQAFKRASFWLKVRQPSSLWALTL